MLRVSVSSHTLLTDRGLLRHLPLMALCALLAGASAQPLLAATTTTTALTVSPTALAPGKPAKLVATVTDTSNKSIFPGTVTFYDGTRLLGTAQIVSHPGGSFAQGTATLNIASFNDGANSITAVFAGTNSYLGSTSPAKTLTVSGQPPQTITGLASFGTSGSYDLTGIVKTFGTALPTGSIDFFNDAGGASLGSLSLSGAKLTGGFVASSEQSGPNGTTGLAVGDFNGDGLLDIAVGFSDNSLFPFKVVPAFLGVYLGNGDGTFAEPNLNYGTSNPKSTTPNSVYVGDFNNDGILDMIGTASVTSLPNTEIAVLYLGKGDGTFQAAIPLGLDQNLNSCIGESLEGEVADFDRDGNLDFVMTGFQTANTRVASIELCVLRGNGDGTFKVPQTLSFSTAFSSTLPVVAGDLNGDGIPDLVVSAISSPDLLPVEHVLSGNGDGTFKPSVTYTFGGGPIYGLDSLRNLALGDLNGDGKLDLVVADSATNSVTLALGKGDGTFGPETTYPVGGPPGQPVILDINGDGKPDIAVAYNNDPASSIPILLGNGDGTFQPAVNYPDDGQSTGFLFQGDFNGDGLPDLFTSYNYDQSSSVLLLQKRSSVTLSGVNLPGPGTSSVYAKYSGDSNYAPSTSCDTSPGVTPEYPTLSGIYSAHITSTTASIGWTSNFPTNGYVGYGTSYRYFTPPDRPSSVLTLFPENTHWQRNATTSHFVTLTGLTPGTVYYFAPTSVGYFSGCNHWTTTSQVQSFTTATQ